MRTQVSSFAPRSIAEAANLVAQGHPVAVPTETVYGLAGDATADASIAAIYHAKGRPAHNPLIVHVADAEGAFRIGLFDKPATALAVAYWPGPLTLVVPLRPNTGLARTTTAGLDTVALRVPAHRAMQALLAATGKPLAAPSANASGTISPTCADHVLRTLGGRIRMIVDDGQTDGGIESTIIGCDERGLRLLRPGPIIIEEARAIGDILIEAPGQLAAHYAPAKPLRLNARHALDTEFLIGFGSIEGHATLSARGDVAEAATRLFGLLHSADAGPFHSIAVAPIPKSGLGIAINDRLHRAASGAPK